MTGYQIKSIPPGSFFSKPVYLDSEFILASPEMPVTREMLRGLETWEFGEVLSEGQPGERYAGGGGGEPEEKAAPEGGEDARIRRAEQFYRDLQGYVERLFMHTAIGMNPELKEVTKKMQAVCAVVQKERSFLLRIQRPPEPAEEQDFLAAHTVRSTVISLIIGNYLKLPAHRLVELGTAALVHEIGMVKIPRRVYSARRGLSPEERMLVLTHPVASYSILKASGFPPAISVGALQHHERENGSGYPQMLTGDKISLYAKIIAVACSYEALTANRPHKNAKDGHTGMLDLLKNEGKVYDDIIVRALVYSLSIYPVGLYVLLSSGRKGQVVDVNPENPRFPIVQVFGEAAPNGRNRIVETSAEGLRIVRPLTREEASSIPGVKG
jgi:HD-GYP domain-containing protein (c-di-GMP phosphodiesterase class II)